MKKIAFLALATIAVAACQNTSSEPGLTAATSLGGVPDQTYIVVFRTQAPDVPGLAHALVNAHGGVLRHTYVSAVHGFAAELPASEIASLQRHPDVVLVELDGIMRAVVTQPDATWGLDRVDQAALPLNGSYGYAGTGAGVNAYIIDTGIRSTHVEFGGRASGVFTSINDGQGTNDCNGHGTHVAGTIGSAKWGIAKQVKLYAVRVLGCSGSGPTSGVIAGVDWLTTNAVKPAVANMSLGGPASTALDQAVQNSIAAGVTYAVAAGNSNANACNDSPSRVPEALTAGATTTTDARASYSNFGSCLDLFAPGSSITSAYNRSDTDSITISGTSMASPHVAGVAALYLQSQPNATPAAVVAAVTANAVAGVVSNPGTGSPNRLLYSGFLLTPNNPPVASFTWSCSGLTCTLDGSGSTDDGQIVQYAWDLDLYPNPTATGAVVSVTYPHSGPRTVTLTVTDNGGKTGSITKTVTVGSPPPPPPVDNPPVANLTWSCNGLTCTLDGSGSTDDGQITQYAWNLPGSSNPNAAGTVVTVSYSTGGSKSVTLTVTDNIGQTGSRAQTITVVAPPPPVDNPPLASFTWTCSELTCTLDGSGSTDDGQIVQYAWDLDLYPNPTATGAVVSATYPHSGPRTVTLTVTDNGGQTNSVTKTFIVP